MKRIVIIFTALILSVTMANAHGILGNWTTPDKKTIIKISQCGDGICGVITKPSTAGALDTLNEKPELRTRKIKGLQLFNLKATDNPKRWVGTLYNARDGKTYTGQLELIGNNQKIKLEGCVFIFCQGEEWTHK